MQLKKKHVALFVALIAAVLIAVLLWMRLHAAPESVRLLPESDAIAYVNLTPLRLANAFGALGKISHEPDYEEFVQQTGVDFERDLDEVAVAVHLPSAQATPGGSAPLQETRFSEVFSGSFDRDRLAAYLRKIGRNTEIYHGKEIFSIPVENRLVRVVVVSGSKVAVSNVDGPLVIHDIIDRLPASRFSLNQPALVREHYKDVPLGSLAWAMGKYSSSGADPGLSLPGGFEVPLLPALPASTTWIVSLRYAAAIELKAQALTPTEDDARKLADMLGTFLSLFRSVQSDVGTKGTDADVKNFFDSLQVTQEGNRTVITADIPVGLVKKIAQKAPAAIAEKPAEPEPSPSPQEKKKKK